MPFGQSMMGAGAALGGMMGARQKPQMGGGMKSKGGMRGRAQAGQQMGAQQPQGLGPSQNMMGGMMRDRAMQQRMGGRGGATGAGMGNALQNVGQAAQAMGGYGQMAQQPQFQEAPQMESFGTSQPEQSGIAPQPDMLRNMMDRKRQMGQQDMTQTMY